MRECETFSSIRRETTWTHFNEDIQNLVGVHQNEDISVEKKNITRAGHRVLHTLV